MERVTGTKRSLDADGLYGKRPAPGQQPHTLTTTSQCPVQDLSLCDPPDDEPPDFSEEALTRQLDTLAELPPSLMAALMAGEYENWPASIWQPQEPPQPPQAIPLKVAVPVATASGVKAGTEADRLLLAELKQTCDRQAKAGYRKSAAAVAIEGMGSLEQLVAHFLSQGESRPALAQGLLSLVTWCESPSAKDFLVSLFLVMRRLPDHAHRKGFLQRLPAALSPQLKHLEPDAQAYWVDACNSGYCLAETQELARQVCAHFDWPVPSKA